MLVKVNDSNNTMKFSNKINFQNQINEITDSCPQIWDPRNIQDCGTLLDKY